MKFDDVRRILGQTPHTPPERGHILYDHVLRHGVADVLELGFAHGASTCYLAAALDEQGAGHILTMDNRSALLRRPSIHDLLERTGLGAYVTPLFADTSYNWELMKLVEDQTRRGLCRPRFDFVFIDGAHTWETDGFAFFLVEKLIRPGGWLLFDDLGWTFSSSPTLAGADWVKAMPDEQRVTAQVERVFTLLVGQHASFRNLRTDGQWGWAQKLPDRRTRARVWRALRATRRGPLAGAGGKTLRR